MGFAISYRAVAAALLATSGLGSGWSRGWAATSRTADFSFHPQIDAPSTRDETGWLMQPRTQPTWRELPQKPAHDTNLFGAAAKLSALWAFRASKAIHAATAVGQIQQTFDVGVKGPKSTSANDLTALTDSITVYGKFSLAHSLPHYPSIKLGESVHLSKTGTKWAGGLGLSVHWDDLTLYGDASVQGSLLDIDVKDLSAHIGVRYVFL